MFSDDFRAAVESKTGKVCEKLKEDPLLIGYFTDNELLFVGKEKNRAGKRKNCFLLDRFLSLPANSPGRTAAVNFLRERYDNNFQLFLKVWSTPAVSFENLREKLSIIDEKNKRTAQEDRRRFFFRDCN